MVGLGEADDFCQWNADLILAVRHDEASFAEVDEDEATLRDFVMDTRDIPAQLGPMAFAYRPSNNEVDDDHR